MGKDFIVIVLLIVVVALAIVVISYSFSFVTKLKIFEPATSAAPKQKLEHQRPDLQEYKRMMEDSRRQYKDLMEQSKRLRKDDLR